MSREVCTCWGPRSGPCSLLRRRVRSRMGLGRSGWSGTRPELWWSCGWWCQRRRLLKPPDLRIYQEGGAKAIPRVIRRFRQHPYMTAGLYLCLWAHSNGNTHGIQTRVDRKHEPLIPPNRTVQFTSHTVRRGCRKVNCVKLWDFYVEIRLKKMIENIWKHTVLTFLTIAPSSKKNKKIENTPNIKLYFHKYIFWL